MKSLLCIFSLICLWSSAMAQSYQPVYYGTQDGLPGTQIYDLVLDDDHYLWVATDLGPARYNGYSFESFSMRDGLPEPVMVRLATASKTVYLLSASRQVYQYQQGMFSAIGSDSLLSSLPGNAVVTSMSASDEGKIYLGISTDCAYRPYYLMFERGQWKLVETDNDMYILPLGETGIYGGRRCASGGQLTLGDTSIKVSVSARDIRATVAGQHTIFWSDGREIYRGTTTMEVAPKMVYRLFANGDKMVAGMQFGGALVESENGLSRNMGAPHTITAFCRDHEGGYWLGTLSNGLLYVRDTEIYNIDGSEGRDIRALSGSEDVLMAVDAGGEVLGFSGHPNSGFLPLPSQQGGGITSMVWDNGPVRLSESDRGPDHLPEPAISYLRLTDTLWLGQSSGIAAFVNGKKVGDGRSAGLNSRVNCLLEYNGDIFIGSIRGLWRYTSGAFSMVSSIPVTTHISALAAFQQTLAIGTLGKGLLLQTATDTLRIDSRNGLPTDFVNSLAFGPDGRLWIATNKGLCLRDPNGQLRVLNAATGLPREEITCMYQHPEYLALGTRNGITIVEKSYFQKAVNAPEVTITGGQLSKADIPFGAASKNVYFEARSYRNLGKTLYRYRLLPDTAWLLTSQSELSLPTQNSGEITLEIQARLNDGGWGPVNREITYRVMPPWWQKVWIWVLVVALLSLLVYGIVFIYGKIVARRNTTKMEIQTLKLQALSAQMNPHFIFNSLNSIQRFLLDNDVRNSNKYLAKFANLMRLILNNSSQTFVGLGDVVQVLQFYMELEQLRFGDKFQFEIQIDPSIHPREIKVPPMLIQPFAENAILHGILPLEGRLGEVKINIRPGNDFSLQCAISDNGVGRTFHADKREKAHKSRGMHITMERLRSYGLFTGHSYQMQIEDLRDALGNTCGTRVNMDLPFVKEA
ncbi:MAG: histidine kinase [Flavobacteriales bacterium]|nr:histidine kinase [Flavobacteriales bacterium]